MKIGVGVLNLCTIWSATGDGVNQNETLETACYSTNFRRFTGHQEYNIWMYRDLTGYERSVRNNTFLTLGELVDHVQWIKDFLPEGIVGDFTVTEEEEEENNLKKFKLNLHITGANIYHKLVLNWIRYAYELPYSLIILDTYRLGDVEELKGLNRINKFILCSSAYTENSRYYWREDMSFGHYTVLHPDKILLERLEKEASNQTKDEYNSFYQSLTTVFGDTVDADIQTLKVDEDLLDTEKWVDGKDFDKRLEIYKENLKFYNKEYEQETT